MINLYRRAARTAAELGLGDLKPMIEAIPELAVAASPPRKGGGKGGSRSEGPRSSTPSSRNHTGITREARRLPHLPRQEEEGREAVRTGEIAGVLGAGGDGSRPGGGGAAASEGMAAVSGVGVDGPGEGGRVWLGEEEEGGGGPLRVELLALLARVMLRGAAGGDLNAARVAHEAIGTLLGVPTYGGNATATATNLTRAGGCYPESRGSHPTAGDGTIRGPRRVSSENL